MFIQIPVAFSLGQTIFPRKDAENKNTTGGTKYKDDISTKKKKKQQAKLQISICPKGKYLIMERKQIPDGTVFFASVPTQKFNSI